MEHKSTLLTIAAAMMLTSGAVYAVDGNRPRFTLAKQSAHTILKRNVASKVSYAASPLKTQEKAQAVVEAVLVDEDFSALTSGTYEKPDTTQMLASEYEGYSPNGIYIDNSLTKDGTWFGSQVYSAGGAIALKTYNPQQQAYLCTPLGDYSGDLTVTFRVKANPALVKTNNGYNKLAGSSIDIQICYGGYNGMSSSNTDDETGYYSVRLYEKDGWQEVTYTCKNYSANNDGYICFSTEGSIVLDDVKVKAGSSFLAQPVIEGITDFQKDNFTIVWQPTRKAFNYYVDLYTRHYLSDSDMQYTADFNDGTMPEGFESSSTAYSDNEGVGGSKGLILKNDDSFTAPSSGNVYKTAHFSLNVVDPTVDPNDEYAKYYVLGGIEIDVKTDDGWNEIGSYEASYFWNNPAIVKFEEDFKKLTAGGFTQLRLRVANLNEGAYVVLDDVDVTAKPAFEYKIVGGDYSQDLENDYCFTANVKETTYTFKDLDPNTEYWYGVRAHYVSQFSERKFIHALGVATPKVSEATDIDSHGSFTANWQTVPKATGYTVNCYGVRYTDKADEDFPILEEDFSNVDASVTDATDAADATPINNESTSSLDAYTKNPGWTGNNNNVAQGMLGADGDYDGAGGRINTPMLYLGNSDQCRFTVKIYAYEEDNLGIIMNGTTYYLPVPDDGVLDGFFTLPVGQERQSIGFLSSCYAPFVIDYLKIGQDLPKGARTLTWLAGAETDAATASYTFTGLDAYDFDWYGYDVSSKYQYDENTAVTSVTPSSMMFVNLIDGVSTGVTELQNNADIKVVARYTADGQLVPAPVKGLNILKMSNGRTMKVIVK